MRPIPATRLGDAHGLMRAIERRGRLRTDEFVTEFGVDELFPPGLENALGRLRHFISYARAAGLVKEDRGVVELTDVGRRYIRSADEAAFFDVSPQQAEWLRRQLREKHMTDSIFHGLAIGLSLLASVPPGTQIATLDFGRAMAYLGRAGWDNDNTLQIQGERHLLLLRDMELIDQDRRMTPTGEQVRGELTLPIHMSLLDLANQLNPGGAAAVAEAAAAEFGGAAEPEPPPEPERGEAPSSAEPDEDEDDGYHTAVGFGALTPPPVVPRPAEQYGAPTEITPASSSGPPAMPPPVSQGLPQMPPGPSTPPPAMAPPEAAAPAGPPVSPAPEMAAPPASPGPETSAPPAPAGPPASPEPEMAAPAESAAPPPSPGPQLAAPPAPAGPPVSPGPEVAAPAGPPVSPGPELAAPPAPVGPPVTPGPEIATPAGPPVSPGPEVAAPAGPPVSPGPEMAASAAPAGPPVSPPPEVAAPPEPTPPPVVAPVAAPAESVAPPVSAAPAPARSFFVDVAAIRGAGEAAGLVLPDGVYANVAAALDAGRHVLLTGPPGCGKTTLALAVARAAARAGRADGAALLPAAEDGVGERVIEAARRGRWALVEELDRTGAEPALGALSTFLGGLPVTVAGGEEVAPSPDWRIVATWGGAAPRGAVLRRFAVVEVAGPPPEALRRALHDAAGGDPTALAAVERVQAVGQIAPLGAGVLLDAARHAAGRNAAAPADAATLAREAFAAYVAPLLDETAAARARELVESWDAR